jgi:nucleosome-remodeling factor subunit BPTF
MAVPRIVKPATATVQTTSSVTTNVTPSGKIFIRQQIPAKTQFVTATTTTAPKILNSEADSQVVVSSSVNQPTQKIITTSGQIITQIPGQATNLQQLLQRGTVTGQKIILNQASGGIQKLLMASPGQQQIGDKQIIIQSPSGQSPQRIIMNQHGQVLQSISTGGQQQIIVGNQKILLSPDQRIVAQPGQQIKTIQQPIQLKIQQSPQATVTSPSADQQQKPVQQVVVQNNAIAQQLAEGKIQLANYNGQQVLIKQIGNGQAQIVGHVKTNTVGQQNQISIASPIQQTQQHQIITTKPVMQSPVQQTQQIVQNTQATVTQVIPQQQQQQSEEQISASVEQSLLAHQPPGTVIKVVTAQVVQTNNGPRIVLQGLQGSDFTQQQTQLVQQQVKQQLLKGTFLNNSVKK